MYNSAVDTAKTIRKELKSAFPGIKFWVTSKNSINVAWVDGPTMEAVNAVVMPFKKVRYCEASGETLSGGNTYVFTDRKYSEPALRHGVELEAKKNRTLWSGVKFEEIELKLDFSGRGFNIVWKPEHTTFEYGRVDLSCEVYENLKEIDLTNGVPVEEVIEALEVIEEVVEVVESTEVSETSEAIQEILDIRADRFEGRKEGRIERYEALAAKHSDRAVELCGKSIEMSKRIPMGQPVHVGHYSEKSDRNYRDRVWNTMGQSVKHSETAEHYRDKAAAAACNTAISSDDPEAIVKLKAKIAGLEAKQERMKATNKIIKSAKIANKIEALQELGHSLESAERIMTPQRWRGVGYQGYELTNNSANIRRLKQRLEHLEKSLVTAATKGDEEKVYPQYGLTVKLARSINRLQLVFEEKPDRSTCQMLGSNGFVFARSNMAWQRRLSNSAYALNRVLEALENG